MVTSRTSSGKSDSGSGGSRQPVTVREAGGTPRRASALAQSIIVPQYRVMVPDEVVAAKEQLVRQLGGFEAHLAARASAAVRPDRRPGMENIVCVYVGEKYSGGRRTGKWAVRVQVLRKLGREEQVEPSAVIEPTVKVGGTHVDTDVEQVPHAPTAQDDYKYQERPALCGDSIGPNDSEGTTGTLGCLLVSNNTLYLMSNNHVLARYNQGSTGDDIRQPGLADAGTLANTYSVATLQAFVPLSLTNSQNSPVAPSTADVALAFTGPSDASYKNHNYTINQDAMKYSIGMTVKKEGRTTGYTVGTVTGTNGDVWVAYGPPVGGQGTPPFAHFQNQLIIQSNDSSPFSNPGDSGSMIVDYASNCPVALLYSGNGFETYAHPIEDVLSALQGAGYPVDKFVTKDDDLN
jgi:hypothetical protein